MSGKISELCISTFPQSEWLAAEGASGVYAYGVRAFGIHPHRAALPLVTVLTMVLTRLAVSWGGPVAHSRAASGLRYSGAATFAALPVL